MANRSGKKVVRENLAVDDVVSQLERFLESFAARVSDIGSRKSGKFSASKFRISVTLASEAGEIAGEFSYNAKSSGLSSPELDRSAIEAFAKPRPTYAALATGYSCSGTHSCSMTFPNTCAIRLSEALVASNPGWLAVFRASGKNVCPHGYVRGAQDLASILASSVGFGIYDFGIDDPGGVVPAQIRSKQGIVIYMDIPTFPDGQGHIGLWNKETGQCSEAYWNAKRVWFWGL